ncbi:MAG: YsnF/AvaK domain-containing protein [Chitinophagaceae bacterium]|nr:YsnF/AvaK domain-containing protein [Rubrivivax sp.]
MAELITVVVEDADVVVRALETGRVRVSKRVVHDEHALELTLRRETVTVERVAINRVVDQPAGVREEGNVTIVPVHEEVLVKQLILKEEVRITRHTEVDARAPAPVTLRREDVQVTRTPPVDAMAGAEKDLYPAVAPDQPTKEIP